MSAQKKQILITGGSGFIGTYLCHELLSNGHEVTVLDLVPSPIQNAALTFTQGDVRKRGALLTQIQQISPDVVYHFAAIVSVQECESNPEESLKTNFHGTQNVIAAVLETQKASQKKIPLFFASSAAVYGDLCKKGMKLNETIQLPEPLSFYGRHKLDSEKEIQGACAKDHLRGLSFRFFNVYGAGQKADSPYSGVMSKFKHAFENKLALQLFNHGNNFRDFISVQAIAEACAKAASLDSGKLEGGALNLCTGNSISIQALLSLYEEKFGFSVAVNSLPKRAGDIEYSCGDPSKSVSLLGLPPPGILTSKDLP